MPDPSSTQEVELAHLTRLASTHPNWIDYCQWKARKLALKYPLEYASLPLLLSSALAGLPVSCKTTTAVSASGSPVALTQSSVQERPPLLRLKQSTQLLPSTGESSNP